MLIQKTNPVGKDVPIQRLQKFLHDELMVIWGIDPDVANTNKLYECYARAHRNKTESGYRAEVFTAGTDYKEVYWNDALKAISFFGESTIETFNIDEKINIHLCFFVDLKKLKPGIVHRADEEVRRDVQLLAERNMFGFVYLSTETGIENVLKDYPSSYKSERLRAVDMHPVHCFRLNFELNYNKDIC